jgi:ammonium transporter, Amt family
MSQATVFVTAETGASLRWTDDMIGVFRHRRRVASSVNRTSHLVFDLFEGAYMRFFPLAALLSCAALLFFCTNGWTQDETAKPAAAEATPMETAAEPKAEAEPAPLPPPKNYEEAVARDPSCAAHTTWMLVSSALVLFMTAPGLAMFYGGLVRKKNVLGVMMQCIFLMGLMTVLWALYGYSLSFGGTRPVTEEDKKSSTYSPYVGNTEYLFMKNVERTWDEKENKAVTPVELNIMPRSVHMLFQGMFFIITPALICGAFAERMKFSTMVVFMILWGTIVYCPLCHWVWDAGILAYGAEGAIAGGALDFAGGTVVHISSGASALVCALLLGKRLGYNSEPMPPHNLTYTVLGAGMLWVGWFGFNAGSQLASDGIAANAFMVTHFSAAAGALSWPIMEWIFRGKPSVLGACSGAVAGLVCITPAAGFVQAMPALLMGAVAGVVCFWSCSTLKGMFKYDDSLDAFGVHGVGGTLGAILTGVFATKATSDAALWGGKPMGLVDGNSSLIMGQVAAVLVTWVLSVVVTFILLKILDATMGLRVTKDQEQQGLDLSQHGEEGYIYY